MLPTNLNLLEHLFETSPQGVWAVDLARKGLSTGMSESWKLVDCCKLAEW